MIYAVSIHDMGEYIEMHAVRLADPDEVPHVARVDAGDAEYQCAVALAGMVGIAISNG